MKFKTKFGLFLLKMARAVRAAVSFALTPSALVELNRRHFGRDAGHWSGLSEAGLFDHESELLERYPIHGGAVLCLGSGGGREAFALARPGLRITGIDQVPELVRFASGVAARRGLPAEFLVGDLLNLDLSGRKFDFILMWNTAYDYLPSKAARVSLVARLRGLLNPGGKCFIHFLVKPPHPFERKWFGFFRGLASILGGNRHVEVGDRIVPGDLFMHFFPSEKEAEAEFREAGFDRTEIFRSSGGSLYAVLPR